MFGSFNSRLIIQTKYYCKVEEQKDNIAIALHAIYILVPKTLANNITKYLLHVGPAGLAVQLWRRGRILFPRTLCSDVSVYRRKKWRDYHNTRLPYSPALDPLLAFETGVPLWIDMV